MNIDKLLGEETVSEAPKEVATTEKVETKPKKKGKPRGGNSPVIGMNGYNLEPGDNTRIMQVNMAIFNMKNIDLEDVEAVENRLNEFFMLYAQADLKPTVAGMALCLNGMRRQQLWAIVNDQPTGGAGYKASLPPEVANTIKKSYILMENMWENYMNSGKINPVSGIFLGKNNFGYQDKTEYVLTPNTNSDSDYSAEDIRARYINSADPKRLSTMSDSNSDTDSDE